MIPDTCCCGRGRLQKGITKYIVEVGGGVVVIRNIPAWICDLCD